MIPALLVFFIHHVVGVASEEKMGRVDTRRRVAMMANAHSDWNIPIMHYPRNTMRLKGSLGENYVSVSGAINSSAPNPTRFSFINLAPEIALVPLSEHDNGSSGHLRSNGSYLISVRGVVQTSANATTLPIPAMKSIP